MMIANKITMDLQNPTYVPTIQVMQKDWYSRSIELTLLAGGEIWEIPAAASAWVSYRKADGKGGDYDTLPDGTQAWSAEGNVLTILLAPQVVTTRGPVQLAVTLMEGIETLSTFLILLNVQSAVGEVREASEEYTHITGFLPMPYKATVGQVLKVTAVNERGKITGMTAVDLESLLSADASDEELLAATYTLTEADYIYGLWNGALDAGSEMPYHTTDINDQFCSRKIRTAIVPKVTYFYFTTPMEYIFWNNGSYAGKKSWAEISEDWKVDFEFDEVGINFSWGWDYVGKDTIVRLSIAIADFEKVLVLGDSISTDYYGAYPKWVTVLTEEGFFPASTTNDSIHATGFVAEYTGEGNADNNFLNRLEAVPEKDSYDLVVVFGGINDYIQGIPMGEVGGDRTVSFIPAVEYFFDYLVNHFSQAKIAVLSPLRTYNLEPNAAGHVQTEYADYIRQTAQKYCLPVLNLTEESGFRPFNAVFRERWTLVPEGYENADGVHPNEEYQKKFLAPMIRDFLKRFA
ncbi:MAG: SGNH/GDSL hydrolase family protein [Oscillospiraceae bacterium]|nr:SGNH/GDSL hydrolase family protein [Oscillospiraceae bacterium]